MFDKLSKTEIETIDIQAWYARSWSLRRLTIEHGSIVRKIYNDLDKKGTLAEFPHLAVLSVPVDQHGAYNRKLTDAEKTEFNDLVAQANLKATNVRRARDNHSIALALRDANTAFLVKILYRGALKLVVLNTQTLQEEVRQADTDHEEKSR